MELNTFIDHTLLKRDVTTKELNKVLDEAIKYHFKTVCIAPTWIKHAKKYLKETGVEITTVIGFPYGQNTSKAKAFEVKNAIKNGADEVDVVANISRIHDRDIKYLKHELKLVRKAAKDNIVKLIIETGLLDNEEKVLISKLAVDAGINYVKTSTGIQTTGATVEDVKLIRQTVGSGTFIKASGGVRTHAQAIALIEAGANRIGTSNGVDIIEGKTGTSEY